MVPDVYVRSILAKCDLPGGEGSRVSPATGRALSLFKAEDPRLRNG